MIVGGAALATMVTQVIIHAMSTLLELKRINGAAGEDGTLEPDEVEAILATIRQNSESMSRNASAKARSAIEESKRRQNRDSASVDYEDED